MGKKPDSGREAGAPGHYIRVDCRSGKRVMRRYWVLKAAGKQKTLGFQDYCERLNFLLRDSVRLRRIAMSRGDFFVGRAGFKHRDRFARRMGPSLNTFSIGFEEDGFDEIGAQQGRIFFHPYGTSTLCPHRKKFAEILTEIMARMDEPIATQPSSHILVVERSPQDRYGGSDGRRGG